MGRPRTNLPWTEKRGAQYRAYWRTETGRKDYEVFTSREDADLFREMARRIGLTDALAAVRGEMPAAVVPDQPAPADRDTASPSSPAAPGITPAALEAAAPGEPARPGQPTGVLFETLCDRFLDTHTGVEDRTIEGYRTIIDLWLRPYFGGTDIGLILSRPSLHAPAHPCLTVADWLTWMATQYAYNARGQRTTKHPSVKRRRDAHGLLYAIFNVALDDPLGGLLLRNPCGQSKLPTEERPEQVFFEWRQVLILSRVIDAFWLPLLMFLVLSGARYGEAAGLTARHTHLHPESGAPYVEIVRALRWTRGKGRRLGRLKTAASRRRISLPRILVPILEPLVEGKTGDDLVFVTKTGQPLHHSNFTNRVLIPALARAHTIDPTIPLHARVHAFRHTHASLVLAHEPNLWLVQRRLGHKSIDTTTRVYGHLLEGSSDALLAALDTLAAGFEVESIELEAATGEVLDLRDPTGADLPEFDYDDTDDVAA